MGFDVNNVAIAVMEVVDPAYYGTAADYFNFFFLSGLRFRHGRF